MVFGVIHMGIDWPFCDIKLDFSYSEKKFSAHFGDNRKGPPYEFEMKMKNLSPPFLKYFQITKWQVSPRLSIRSEIIIMIPKESVSA